MFSHDMDVWAHQLGEAASAAPREVGKIVGRGSLNIKKDAQRRVRGHPHLPHLARSYTYDVVTRPAAITGEIGAEHERRQGKLDVFVEHGSPTSAPIPHWGPAAAEELPRFGKACEDLAVRLLEDR